MIRLLARTCPARRASSCICLQRSSRYASGSNIKVIIPTEKLIKEQTEDIQLPDDSKFVSVYFDELKEFRDSLSLHSEKTTFTDYQDDPNLLISELEKYIQIKIFPYDRPDSMGQQLLVKRYKEMLRDFKTTLVLNGGHPFVFDLLMKSQEELEKFDKNKSKKTPT